MIRVSAPGSIMITGEHAVVYGHPAMVAAIDQRLVIEAQPRADRHVQITSDIAAPKVCALSDLAPTGPYRFVEAALATAAVDLPGLDLRIRSEIDPTLGLGSSAAVTVAVLALVDHLTGVSRDIHSIALSLIQTIQGRGSGADLAASLHGGLLAYQIGTPAMIEPLPAPPQLSLANVGYKTPTGEVLAMFAERMAEDPERFALIYKDMGASSQAAITAARGPSDWPRVATHLTEYHGLMQNLGVSDAQLDALVLGAMTTPDTLAAKISGSGLGDCVVAMGAVPKGFHPVALAPDGVIIDD